jgi:hypothetical protein
VIDALQEPIDRLDQEVHQHAKADPRIKVLTLWGARSLRGL